MTEQEQDTLLLYWSGEADSREIEQAEALLESDPEAKAFVEQLDRQQDLLQDAFHSGQSLRFADTVLTTHQENTAPEIPSTKRTPAVLVAAAVALLAAATWLLLPETKSPTPLVMEKSSIPMRSEQLADFSSRTTDLESAASSLFHSNSFQNRHSYRL